MKDEISQTLTTNKPNNREERGAPLVAFGALTALTAGAGIASAVGSFLVVAEKQVEIVKTSTLLENYKTMTRCGQSSMRIWRRKVLT